jgi:hexosaminidase
MARRAAALICGAGFALAAAASPTAAQQSLNVIPEPRTVTRPQGDLAQYRLAEGASIVVPAGDAEALKTGRYLSALIARTRGLTLPVQAGGEAPRNAIRLVRATAPVGEAYVLDVAEDGVRVAAHDDAGLFYGAATLWELATANPGGGPAVLPAVHVEDAPRFRWRGLMIDSARHFQSVAEIERVLDAMALHKLNVLHWHLTDDQGWRLEIKKYPRLTTVGAWRTPNPGSPDGSGRYGGFYTQDQVREVVAYAAARHITIVPEIEMPSHAVSALIAYPELGAGGPPPASAQSKWGGFPYVYDVSDRTFGFLEDVLTEVMALFPGRYIHVGGDEAQRERWNASPAAAARLKALGTTDPAALQVDFTHRIAAFLATHGRTLVGWDEILQGGDLPGEAVITSWHGVDGGLAAAAKGHDAVLAPAPVLYFDNRQGDGPDEPPGRGFLVRLRDVYGFEPAPPTLNPDAAGHILGLQGNVWTEHVRTEADLEAMVFPRIAAVAETGWSTPERKDWSDFVRRLTPQFARYDALGLRADRAALAVRIAPGAAGTVTLGSETGGQIRYTTDGSDPTPRSALYEQPFAAPASRVRAAAFFDEVRITPVAERTTASLDARPSQELRLCNDRLALNLEGAPGPQRRSYLVNPLDACWVFQGADLDRTGQVTVSFQRLAFNFGLDPAHNAAVVRPPRGPSGEVELRQDSCLADPIAVATLPPGKAGERGEVALKLPPRSGRHDLCVTFTGSTFDPVVAVERVRLLP